MSTNINKHNFVSGFKIENYTAIIFNRKTP